MAAILDGSSAPLTAKVLHAKNVAVYKVVAGEASTLLDYNESCLAEANGVSLEELEWRGLYTQFKRDHVLGTIPYRWERGDHTAAHLVRATFDLDLDIVVLDGPMMHDGRVGGSAKATWTVIRTIAAPDGDARHWDSRPVEFHLNRVTSTKCTHRRLAVCIWFRHFQPSPEHDGMDA